MDPQSTTGQTISNGIWSGESINNETRPTTPPPLEKPNGICNCKLNKCTCCYAPIRNTNRRSKQ